MLSKKSHLAMININTMFFQPQRFPLTQCRDKIYWLCVTFCVMFSLLIYLSHTPTQDKLPTLYITLCSVFTFDLFIPRILRLFFLVVVVDNPQKKKKNVYWDFDLISKIRTWTFITNWTKKSITASQKGPLLTNCFLLFHVIIV